MPSIVIAGGGLVGAVNACFFGRRGWTVAVFESRSDPRGKQIENGKSINLALGFRALSTLDEIGLKEKVMNMGVAVRDKICHQEGKQAIIEKLQVLNEGDFLLTINRHKLSQLLIGEAEKYSNVKFNFNSKATKFDVENKNMIVETAGNSISVDGDLIIACDGAHSSIRKSILKVPGFGFNQKYIDIGYMDLSLQIPDSHDFKLGIHYSWRRIDAILVALVNADRSLTISLFAKFSVFDEYFSSPEDALMYFKKNFSVIYNVLGEKHIQNTFSRNKAQAIISVQCSQHLFFNKLLLMGDSAHAMVPFQGQGVNCGFEDCLVLHEMIEDIGEDNLEDVVREYSKIRTKETNIMNQFEWDNYMQLKQSMNYYPSSLMQSVRFFLKNYVSLLLPSPFVLATFSRLPYSEIVSISELADKCTTYFLISVTLLCLFSFVFMSFLLY